MMNNIHTNKNTYYVKQSKKKKLRWWHIVLIVFASLFFTGFTIFAIDAFTANRGEVRYHKTEFAASEIWFFDFWSNPFREIGYFTDLDTAIDGAFSEISINERNDEIVRFKYDNEYLIVFASYITGGNLFHPIIPIMRIFLFEEHENGNVSVEHFWFQETEAILNERRRLLFDEDRIARDIVMSQIYSDVTARANGGVPIFYGVGVGIPPTYMSILGYEPDNVFLFEYRGKEYFFWYYLSAPYFGEVLSDNIDIAGTSIILAEVIELFDIQIVR